VARAVRPLGLPWRDREQSAAFGEVHFVVPHFAIDEISTVDERHNIFEFSALLWDR
jgi:hypothetical protein